MQKVNKQSKFRCSSVDVKPIPYTSWIHKDVVSLFAAHSSLESIPDRILTTYAPVIDGYAYQMRCRFSKEIILDERIVYGLTDMLVVYN